MRLQPSAGGHRRRCRAMVGWVDPGADRLSPGLTRPAADPGEPRMIYASAQAMATWLEWQRAYRFGVLLVLPPEPIRSQIDALRAIYDPTSHAGVEVHISLTVPFPAQPGDQAWLDLARIAAGFQPFTIR